MRILIKAQAPTTSSNATEPETETGNGNVEPATRHRLPISSTMKITRQRGRLRCGPCAVGRG